MRRNKLPSIFYVPTINATLESSETDNGGDISPDETLQAGRPIWTAVVFQPENKAQTYKNILLSYIKNLEDFQKRDIICMLSAFKDAGIKNIYYFLNGRLTQKSLHEISGLDDKDDKDDDKLSVSKLSSKLESGNVTLMAERLKEIGENLEHWFILDSFAVAEWIEGNPPSLVEAPLPIEKIKYNKLFFTVRWKADSIRLSPPLAHIRKEKIRWLMLRDLNVTHVSSKFFSDLGLTALSRVTLLNSDINLLQFMPKDINELMLNGCDCSKLDFSDFQNLSMLTLINCLTSPQLNLKSLQLKTLNITGCPVVTCTNINSEKIKLEKCEDLTLLEGFGDNLIRLKIENARNLRKIPELKPPLEEIILKDTGIKTPPALPTSVKIKGLDEIYDSKADPVNHTHVKSQTINTNTVNTNAPLFCTHGIWKVADGKLERDNTVATQARLRLNIIDQMIVDEGKILDVEKNRPEPFDTDQELKFSLAHKNAIVFKDNAFTESDLLAMESKEYCVNFEVQMHKTLSLLEYNDGWLVLPQLDNDDWIKCISVSPTNSIEEIIFINDLYWLKLNHKAAQYPLITINYICSSEPVPIFKSKPTSRSPGCSQEALKQFNDFLLAEAKKIPEEKDAATPFQKFVLQLLEMKQQSEEDIDSFAFLGLKDYFREFKEGVLQDQTLAQSQPIFAIIKEGLGSCYHRSAGYVLTANWLGRKSRKVTNPIHVEAEVQTCVWGRVEWLSLELGGYEALIVNKAPPLPFQETKAIKSDDLGPPAKYKNLFSSYLDIDTKNCHTAQDLLALALSAAPGNLFIPAADSAQARAIFKIICQVVKSQFSKQPIFYAESYQQFINGLSWTRIKPEQSPENVIGLGGKVLNKGGFFVVYLKNFLISDIVKFMNFLEVKPTFVHPQFRLEISSQLRVIVLLANNSYYSPLVTRESPHLKWPKEIAVPTYDVLQSSSTAGENPIVIDLSGYLNKWQDICFGNFIFTENGYAYQPGKLATLSPTKSTIQWIVTPEVKADDNFQYFLTLLGATGQLLNINGEIVDLNIDPDWSFLSETKEKGVLTHLDPLSGENISLTELTTTKTDCFYVDSATQRKLFQHLTINKDGRVEKKPGWAQLPPEQKQSGKIIVDLRFTNKKETATAVEEMDLLAEQKNIAYLTVDQCELKKNQPIQDLSEIKKFEPGAWIITTTDPGFISNHIQHRLKTESDAKTTIYLIDSTFRGFELVSWDQEKSKSFDFRYQHQLLRITQQWIAGENIILQGTLSPHAYSAMLTSFNKMANIWLKNNDKPVLLTGTLIAIIPPSHALDRRHLAIAALNDRYFEISTAALLAEYAKQVLIDIPDLNTVHFEKIKLLLKIIAKLPKLPDSPPHPPISYQRTLAMIAALEEKKTEQEQKYPLHDSLFKPLFAQFSGEYAALLNVLGKLYFPSTQASQEPLFRFNKFLLLSPSIDHYWQILNCANAALIKGYFKGKTLEDWLEESSSVYIRDVDLLRRFFEEADKRYIGKNPLQYQKVMSRIFFTLQSKQMVILTGPPGTGKSHVAFEIAGKMGGAIFSGLHNILPWAKFQEGRCVLIIDEIDCTDLGFLDKLLGVTGKKRWINDLKEGKTYPLDDQHYLIGAGNFSQKFSGRNWHQLLIDIPAVIMKPWSNEAIEANILLPLLPKHLKSKKITATILGLYRFIQSQFYAGRIGNRDLIQFIQSWLFRCQRGESKDKDAWKKLAYHAAIDQWQDQISPDAKKSQFAVKLKAKLKLQNTGCEYSKQAILATHFGESKSSSDFQLFSPAQIKWMYQAYEAWQIAESAATQKAKSSSLAVKLGVLLIGPSGVGKSYSFRQLFLAAGYIETTIAAILDEKVTNLSTHFAEFTLNDELVHWPKVFTNSFHKGCKCILNEINSLTKASAILFNHLLTGRDLDGQPATVFGFFVAASFNVNYSHLKSLSGDLMDRYVPIKVEEPNDEERLSYIARRFPELPATDHAKILEAFNDQRRKTPALTNSRIFFWGLRKLTIPTSTPVTSTLQPVIESSLLQAST